MDKLNLYQYAIIWHPTTKQQKDEGLKSILLEEPTTILAKNESNVLMAAAMKIPSDKKTELDQIEIAVRPF